MWAEAEARLDQAVREGWTAGCALAVISGERLVYSGHRGWAELRPRRRLLRSSTAWDLASLTKVLATASIAARLVAQGRLDLEAPIAERLPGAPPGLSARHLLQHASGLPAWAPLYATIEAEGRSWGTPTTRRRLVELAMASPLLAPPGQRHCYSDLGFLLLGALLEDLGGARIDALWAELVGRPSGVDLRWGWPGAAATEDCPLRGAVQVGVVHDLNAAVMGGIAPHAGLFGSAEEVARLGAWWLGAWSGERPELPAGVAREFLHAAGPGSHRLGWDGVSPGASSAGPRWPLDGAGHLGFTGTSLWLAPRQRVAVALLANRVHPEVEGGAFPGQPLAPRYAAFKAWRPAVHSEVARGLRRLGAAWEGA